MAALTEQDVVKIITRIRINFENAYNLPKTEMELLIDSWYSALKPYPKELVGEAAHRVLSHAEFVPRIGNIVNEIEKMQQAFAKSDGELWAELKGVLYEANRCFHSFHLTYKPDGIRTQGEIAAARLQEIFDGLSDELRDFLGNMHQLAVISEYDAEQLSYERGRFLKLLPTFRSRVQMRKTLSQSALALLTPGTSPLSLPDKSGNRTKEE